MVRPALPWFPRARGTAFRLRGGSGVGKASAGGVLSLHCCTGLPAKRACRALWAQEVGSEPSTEWPVLGTTSTCASGIWAATSRAFAVGVRRSSAPLRIRVGTFGSGASLTSGPEEANGHEAQGRTSLNVSALAGVNGANALAGCARSAVRASRRRTLGLDERFHGN